MRVINYVFYGALLALATLTLGFIVLVRFNFIANPLPTNLSNFIPRAYIVQSGSMAPAIGVGSIVIVQKSDIYSPNDVITFKNSPNDKNPTTHRIHFKEYPQGVAGPAEYLTAGDANEEFDTNKVKEEQIVGKVVFTLPYAGYIADFAKKPYGFILLVIVPTTIIIYEELKFLKREFGKGLSKFWSRIQQLLPPFKGSTFKGSRTMVSNINFLPTKTNKPLPRISLVLPFLGAFLVITSLSLAYFFDIENSIGNIFGAGTWGPPPPQIAQTLVMNELLPLSSCDIGQTNGQFLELWNGSGGTVNLQNFKLSDGTATIAIANSSTNLPNNAFAILVKSNGVIEQCLDEDIHGAVTVNLGGQLDLNTGTLRLLDSSDTVVDTILWGTGQILQPSIDQSIEREPDGHDSATGVGFVASDFVVRNTPQPGQ